MALMTRISRLFLADMNAILDQLEEPEALLKQAVREMEEEIAGAEHAAKEQARALAAGDEQMNQLSDQLDAVNAKVALAMDADDADLARDMLRRRLTLEQHLAQMRDRQARNVQQLSEQAERLANWRDRHQSVVQKLSILSNRAPTAPTADPAPSVSAQDVQVAYLAELQKRQSS